MKTKNKKEVTILKLIDFSDGIRADEIWYNFNVLQDQINRERKSVGGSGIASGLELTPIVNFSGTTPEFAIEISEASIVGKNGEEIHIAKQKINIELPKLAKEIEYLTSSINNQITLKHIPYSLDRTTSVETSRNFSPLYSGIDIKYKDSIAKDDFIRVRSINDKTLMLTGLVKRDLVVTYQYSGKRIDTIYIDKNNEVKVISSTTSPSPSVMFPKEYKYLIAFIEVDNLYRDADSNVYANIIIRKDLRSLRNIYTDSNGDLWLCGVPFKNLQIIHTSEPKDPNENALWYDTYTNELKVWKSTDSLVYMNEYTVTTNYNESNATKDYPTDIYFYVGKKQLEVYVNDVKLDEEEFDEIIDNVPADLKDIQKNVMTNVFRINVDLKLGDKIIYKITNFDEHKMWVPVNHSSYINSKEVKMFGPESEAGNKNYYSSSKAIALGKNEDLYPYKYQYFIFDRYEDLNMFYTPGKHELDILVNQMLLHKDQFEEITVYDLYSSNLPTTVLTAAMNEFGWDRQEIENFSGEYENTGIGFYIKEPLDVPLSEEDNGAIDLYVEAQVQRRVNDGPLKRKLQRSATFIKEESITIKESNEIIDIENAYYRYGENQLEIYINGIKKVNGIDFIEGTDLSDQDSVDEEGNVNELAPRRKGAKTKQFTLVNATIGSTLTYKITNTIYSYDHINQLIDELDYNAKAAVTKVEDLYDKTIEIQNQVNGSINEIITEIEEVKNISQDLDGKYMKKDDVLTVSQMPPSMISNLPQSLDHISCVINYNAGKKEYSIKSYVREADFIIAIKRNVTNQLDKFLIRNVDYSIYDTVNLENNYEDTIFAFSESAASLMNTGDIVILTGIKFGKVGR